MAISYDSLLQGVKAEYLWTCSFHLFVLEEGWCIPVLEVSGWLLCEKAWDHGEFQQGSFEYAI